MILEIAILNIKRGFSSEFETNFEKAKKIISSMEEYISHELKKSAEEDNKYVLLVNWETIEAHRSGFRKSDKYQQWKKLLHHFYEPFPKVEYYK